MIAILLSLLLLGIYFYVIFNAAKELINTIRQIKPAIFKLLYAIALLVPGLLLYFLLKNERAIYYWDFSGYWGSAIVYTKDFFSSPGATLKRVYFSIQYDEYNILPNVLLAPANKLIGLKFCDYIFSIYLIYCLPFSLVMSSIVIKLNHGIKTWLKLFIPFIVLCFTPCLLPLRFGFLDIVGLTYIAIIISILLRSNYFRDLKITSAIGTGLLLLLLIFNRRWYAFWFVSFFFAVFLLNLFYAIKHKNQKAIINTCINLGIAGTVAMGIMLVFFYPYFEMTVLKDYADIYSAYRGTTPINQVRNFITFFGMFILLTSFAGLVFSFKKHLSLVIFFCVSAIVIIVLFTRVNDFGGYQHFYLMVPFFLFFFIQAVLRFSHKKYIVFVFFALLLVNNIFVFALNTPESTNPVFAKADGTRMDRSDYEVVNKMSDKVISLQQAGSNVYCIASSSILNDDILKSIKLPDHESPVYMMSLTQHVDKRDHFPNELFFADYVIVTDPVQVHLGENNQKLIVYFNEAILKGDLKKYYKKEETYHLQKNVTAYLLKKIASPGNAEIQKMYDYFKDAYPEYENMYAVNRALVKISDIKRGDGYGSVFSDAKDKVCIYPGSTIPSQLSINPDAADTTLSFTASFNNKESLAANCNPEKDGEVYLIIKQDGITTDSIYVTHKEDKNIVVDLKGKKKITLIVNKGKNEDYCDWFMLNNFTIK